MSLSDIVGKNATIMIIVRKYGYALWLGMALQASGITVTDWRFYVIAIPVVMLVEWGYRCRENETANSPKHSSGVEA